MINTSVSTIAGEKYLVNEIYSQNLFATFMESYLYSEILLNHTIVFRRSPKSNDYRRIHLIKLNTLRLYLIERCRVGYNASPLPTL